MAWYYRLFEDLYSSSVGAKILSAIELSIASGDLGNIQKALLCYLAVRKFERISKSFLPDTELEKALLLVADCMQSLGHPLLESDWVIINNIFNKNGFIGNGQ